MTGEAYERLVRFEAERARQYYRQAAPLLEMICLDSRPALWAMMALYSGILQRMEALGFPMLERRVELSAGKKLGILARAWWMRLKQRRQGSVSGAASGMTLSETSPEVVVIGGGLAGMAAASALGGAGFRVDLLERRPYLGGRAASYELPRTQETIDNCQHVLLGCCTNLLHFYNRLEVGHLIGFHDRIRFVTPGGRMSAVSADHRPPPLHLFHSLRTFHALTWLDKVAICAAMAALSFELGMVPRKRLDSETMLSWLERHWQTRRAVDFFWRVVLTSALNEDLERASAWHGLLVFWKGFLVNHGAFQLGVPVAPLGELYRLEMPGVRVHLRAHARSLETSAGRVNGARPWRRALRYCPLVCDCLAIRERAGAAARRLLRFPPLPHRRHPPLV